MILEYSILLLVAALGFYAACRFAFLGRWRLIVGASRLLALWCASAWVGYGTPLYVAAVLLLLAPVWKRLSDRIALLVAFELAIVVGLVWHSGQPLIPIYLIGLVLFDQFTSRLLLTRFDRLREPRVGLCRGLLVLGCAAAAVLAIQRYQMPVLAHLHKQSPTQILNLVPQGMMRLWFEPRSLVTAGGDGIYWESRWPETGEKCALSFHGAAATGSLQGASRTILRGVQQAGYRVFALDHPGFGASTAPLAGGPIDNWNPALFTDAVLDRMRADGCTQIAALGHSQGVTEALRLFTTARPALDQAIVMGAGMYLPDPEREQYWHERFHIDRGLNGDAEQLSFKDWKLVRDLYYLNQEYCANTPTGRAYEGGTALEFVVFEREHENLVATRDKLWDCLDYPAREYLSFPTGHYFDSLSIGDLVLIDADASEWVRRRLEP